jgi:hypothetical protein
MLKKIIVSLYSEQALFILYVHIFKVKWRMPSIM